MKIIFSCSVQSKSNTLYGPSLFVHDLESATKLLANLHKICYRISLKKLLLRLEFGESQCSEKHNLLWDISKKFSVLSAFFICLEDNIECMSKKIE